MSPSLILNNIPDSSGFQYTQVGTWYSYRVEDCTCTVAIRYK